MSTKNNYCLGHMNFGFLTTHVPGQNFKTYQTRIAADVDCDALKKRNPQMKVLVCTPMGTPVRVATNQDR